MFTICFSPNNILPLQFECKEVNINIELPFQREDYYMEIPVYTNSKSCRIFPLSVHCCGFITKILVKSSKENQLLFKQ